MTHLNIIYDTDPREQRCMYCRLLPLTWRQHASLIGEGKRSRDSCVIEEGIKENGQVDHCTGQPDPLFSPDVGQTLTFMKFFFGEKRL